MCMGMYVIVHVCIVWVLVCVSSGWSWTCRHLLQEGSGLHSQQCDLWTVCYPISSWRVPGLQECLPGLLRTQVGKPPRRYHIFQWSVRLICLYIHLILHQNNSKPGQWDSFLEPNQFNQKESRNQGCSWTLGALSYILLGGPITAKPSLTYCSLQLETTLLGTLKALFLQK